MKRIFGEPFFFFQPPEQYFQAGDPAFDTGGGKFAIPQTGHPARHRFPRVDVVTACAMGPLLDVGQVLAVGAQCVVRQPFGAAMPKEF